MATVTYNRPQPQQRLDSEHTIIKAEKFTQLGVAALRSLAWLPQFFTMFPGDRFKGALNDTLSFPTGRYTIAGEYEWRTRLNPVQLQRIGQTTATVKLDKHLVQAVPVTNEQATMDIRAFGAEIVVPQVEAMRVEIHHQVMKGLRAAPLKVTNINATTADNPFDVAVAAHLALQRSGVPNEGRFWIVGANAEEWLLRSEVLMDPARGGNALAQNNTIGRIRGFDVISGSTLIGENEMYFGHRSGLLVANIAPEAPFDVPNSSRVAVDGFSLMGTLGYSDSYQATVSTFSTFMGVNSVNDELQLNEEGLPVFNDDGDPIMTGKNVRIASGQFTS
ncbi:UNVERIFIED_CONTAM: hypothetical protein IGO34_23025 [Salmonella enterica subsp. enterica serovar Weltevreden]